MVDVKKNFLKKGNNGNQFRNTFFLCVCYILKLLFMDFVRMICFKHKNGGVNSF